MNRGEWFATSFLAGALIPTGGDGMQQAEKMEVSFIAGFGPIVPDVAAGRKLYRDALGIPFQEEHGGYLHTSVLSGAKHFALWPLSEAAQSCFGRDSWPDDVPVPQAWLEFDVESVEQATAKLESQGYRMLVKNRKEPWGQTVSRFIDPEGILVGVTFTPSMREKK
jgi:catechol 2,3-dioxygenase-like lactoylglutathione lyase family enzyme